MYSSITSIIEVPIARGFFCVVEVSAILRRPHDHYVYLLTAESSAVINRMFQFLHPLHEKRCLYEDGLTLRRQKADGNSKHPRSELSILEMATKMCAITRV